jgi:hypothetical protein
VTQTRLLLYSYIIDKDFVRFHGPRPLFLVRNANGKVFEILEDCLLRQVIEGKMKGGIEVTGRRGRRRRKLLDDLKERRG